MTPADSASAAPARVLLTVEEAADLLGIGRTLMFALLARGEVRSVRIGRLRRVRPADIAEYVAQLDSDAASTAA